MLDAAVIAPESIRPLSRAEYERLVALGCFEDERIELLEGTLVSMSPQGPRHVSILRRLTRLLVVAIGDRAEVQVQGPLALGDTSEPEPDLALVPPGCEDVLPSHAFLVIEVADSSLDKDRRVKAPLYAAAGIPEYWIVNLADRVIEVHRDPRDGAYGNTASRAPGDTITLAAFADVCVAVADIL